MKNETWKERFDEKWLRMRKGGFGRHSSLDDRMIWEVDDDEDAWVFADETIKAFINQTLKEERERVVRDILEMEQTIGESDNSYGTEAVESDDIKTYAKANGIKL